MATVVLEPLNVHLILTHARHPVSTPVTFLYLRFVAPPFIVCHVFVVVH